MASTSTLTNSSNLGSDTSSPPCEDSASIDWPNVSPIQCEQNDESIDVEVIHDAIVTALSTRSEVGTPQSYSYLTPTKVKALPSLPPEASTPPRAHHVRIAGPREDPPTSPHYDVALLLQQSWRKAIRVLRANPSLMTRAILSLALKQRPPVYVVDWMLRLNPDAAAAPPSDKSPSPLFVAVQEGCSVAVVETVLRACPKALVSRPSGSKWDPVAMANRERPEEKDLLALLHRPISYWLEAGNENDKDYSSPNEEINNWPRLGAQKKKTTVVIPEVVVSNKKGLDQVRQKLVMSPPKASPRLGIEKRETAALILTPETNKPSQRQAIPSLLHRTRPLGTTLPTPSPVPPLPRTSEASQSYISSPASSAQSSWTAAERQEMENIKFLCLALLKAHRRLLETQHQQRDDAPDNKVRSSRGSPSTTHLDESERQALLRAMEERQEEQNRICLIALDMKEKSIRALARRLEERLAASTTTTTANNNNNTNSAESRQLSKQLRSSYVHLYQRFLGLEEELHRLKETAAGVTSSSSSSSQTTHDSCRAVFDPPSDAEQPRVVYTKSAVAVADEKTLDDTQSLFSSDEERGECSKSCLRWASFRFHSSS